MSDEVAPAPEYCSETDGESTCGLLLGHPDSAPTVHVDSNTGHAWDTAPPGELASEEAPAEETPSEPETPLADVLADAGLDPVRTGSDDSEDDSGDDGSDSEAGD